MCFISSVFSGIVFLLYICYNYIYIYIYICQVFLFDLSASRGKDTTKEFQQIYGETKASFTQCDVSNKDQFTG